LKAPAKSGEAPGAACKKFGRLDRNSVAAELISDNGATNVLRIVRNLNPPAVNFHKILGGNNASSINAIV
jgi:hypothetical protein